MQINSLNSLNFGQKVNVHLKSREERKAQTKQLADEYRDMIPDLEGEDENGLTLQEKLDILDGAVERANSNVHPSTVICSVLGMVGAGLAATKFTKAGRKLAVTVGEGVSKTAVDAFAKLKKKGEAIDVEAIKANITAKADKLREGNPNSKFLENVTGFTSKVLGDEKAQLVQEKLTKAGVVNGVSAFDAAAGVVAAATVLDPVSDGVEQQNDRKEILETVNTLLAQ